MGQLSLNFRAVNLSVQIGTPIGKKRDAFLAAKARGVATAWLRSGMGPQTHSDVQKGVCPWLWSTCVCSDFHHSSIGGRKRTV